MPPEWLRALISAALGARLQILTSSAGFNQKLGMNVGLRIS